jgi:hypothetical protein
MELLGLFDEGASLRPHLIFRITHHANLGKPTFNFSAGPLQHNLAAANTSKQVSVKNERRLILVARNGLTRVAAQSVADA